MVEVPLPPPMDLDLRLEAQDEEELQQVEANEPLEWTLKGLTPR